MFNATADNILQQVETYQPSLLATLLNADPWISTANMKFKNFNGLTANLGDTVTFDLPPRFVTNDTLVATFQGAEQRVLSLTCNQAKNVAYSFTSQQFIFNVEDYMQKFGKAAMAELGSIIGGNIAQTAVDDTYRAFNATSGGMTSIRQYNQAIANMRDYGAPQGAKPKIYVDLVTVPTVVDNALNQFTQNRNNGLANSWDLGAPVGMFADFYSSNLLPIHTAGEAGDTGRTLTVTAINAAGTSITFSGAGSETDSLVENDIIEFDLTNVKKLYFLTFVGHQVSRQKVQVRVTENTDSSGGNVTATIFPALISDPTDKNCNINLGQQTDFLGTTAKVIPSHRAGLITIGDPLFVAMPRLDMEVPYPTAIATDPTSGASLRSYYGSKFAQNEKGFIHDAIWGKKLAGDYAMRICYPL